jgi:hypothetical protein
MFPAGRQLPHLEHLALRWESRCAGVYDTPNERQDRGSITTADLRSIISACPGLYCLRVRGVVAADADVSLLLQLPTTCCSLEVAGRAFDECAAGVIGQLTQLTNLDGPMHLG